MANLKSLKKATWNVSDCFAEAFFRVTEIFVLKPGKIKMPFQNFEVK